jgi:hypothetical protein
MLLPLSLGGEGDAAAREPLALRLDLVGEELLHERREVLVGRRMERAF